jgi:alpha-L-fucosidase
MVGIAAGIQAFETDDAYNHRLKANNSFVKVEKTGDWKLSEDDGAAWEKYRHLDADTDSFVSFEEFTAGVDLPDHPWDGKVIRNIVCKRVGNETVLLDIYSPRNPGAGKAPVFYYTHGGGWSGGSKEIGGDIQQVIEKLSDQGFACVSVHYRLVKIWNPDDPVLMRDCAVDCRDGLRFLKKYEDELNLDMDRVVVFGSSAGGHLAQLLTFSGADTFAGDPSLAEYNVEPAAGISWFGPSDFREERLFEWNGENKRFESDHWARFIDKSESFNYETDDERIQKIMAELSPVWWLTADSASLLHIHGAQDSVIPPQHAEHLRKHAEACGANVAVQMVNGAAHGWWNPGIKPTQKEIVQMTVDFAVKHVEKPVFQTRSIEEAQAMFRMAPATDTTTPYLPTTHPGAQWFGDAGFGLFIHWGIYSCRELNPSWVMLHNRFGPKYPRDIEVADYYALANEFNPQNYDPDVWMKMAKSIGMSYVVITTKHHDGYCLWPSAYGDYSTKNGAGGRDLIREYVEAARRNGLKVGFYYSPRDWGYNKHISGFPVAAQKFDSDNPKTLPFPEEENLQRYHEWVDFTVGQLSELLTQYGEVDVLWFDGAHWLGNVPNNETGNKIRNWIYELQPQIVINPRWGSVINPDYSKHASAGIQKIQQTAGDFYTFESKWDHIIDPAHNAGVKEPIWFEFCDIWKSWGWGYVKTGSDLPDTSRMQRTLERLSTLRGFGGNYLLNVGPGPDGKIREDIMAEAVVLSEWITLRREAFFDIEPVKDWQERCDAPLTRRGTVLYVHLTGANLVGRSEIQLVTDKKAVRAEVLGRSDLPVELHNLPNGLKLKLPDAARDPLGEVLKIIF